MAYKSRNSMGAIGFLIYLAFIFSLAYGWINNIIIINGSNFDNLSGQLILRIIGVFVAPLGAVMGYL